MTDGHGGRARGITIRARDWKQFEAEVAKGRRRFGLEETAAVKSCYEAGREGFWVHRALIQMGIDNIVVDAASIEVNRRAKRAKTDRLDAEKLVRQLVRYSEGERGVWSVVRVPSAEVEQERQLNRELGTLPKERTAHQVRIRSLLFTQGVDVKVSGNFIKRLEKLRVWDGQALAGPLRRRLERECRRLELVEAMMRELRKQQKQMLEQEQTPSMAKIRRLQQLSGIGMASSWTFVKELLGWRSFKNRRELAGALGLVPMPHQSGDSHHKQGISHAGNRRVRAMAVEIAWSWLRYQSQSRLSQWYRKRFAKAGPRQRKIGIAAMARKLMIDLWRYLETDLVPPGARLKPLTSN
jgi:transposase